MGSSELMTIEITRGKILATVFILLGFFLIVIGLDRVSVHIPVLRGAVSFVLMSIVPGFLFLKIIKVREVSNLRFFLYAIGISLTLFMLSVATTDLVLYQCLNMKAPLTELTLSGSFTALILFLGIIYYFYGEITSITFDRNLPMREILWISLLPFLSIFGTYLVNFHHSNLLLMFLLLIIAVLPLVFLPDRFPDKLYPLLVFMISLSLTYHTSLISTNLWGSDINVEHYFSKLTLQNSHWNPALHKFTAMLGVSVLYPSFSILSGISLPWFFKSVYPVILSLLPVILYEVFRSQTNPRIAFLSVFLIMSAPHTFYTRIVELPRQGFAMIFLALIFLLIFDRKIEDTEAEILVVLFSFSLIVSHYAVSYVWMVLLVIALVLSYFLRTMYPREGFGRPVSQKSVVSYVVMALGWYIFVAEGANFRGIVELGEHLLSSIGEIGQAVEQSPIYWATYEMPSQLHTILRLLYFITQGFTAVGLSQVLIDRVKSRPKEEKFPLQDEYLIYSGAFSLFLLATVLHPYLTGPGSLDFIRFYGLSLLILAPFCVIGGIATVDFIGRMVYRGTSIRTRSFVTPSRAISVFFCIFFLFNSEVIFEIAGVYSSSIALSQDRVMKTGSMRNKIMMGAGLLPEEDASCVKWLSENRNSSLTIYLDWWARDFVRGGYGMMRESKIGVVMPDDISKMKPDWKSLPEWEGLLASSVSLDDMQEGYIYLRKFNHEVGIMTLRHYYWNISELDLENGNKIYTNEGSSIYTVDSEH